MSTFAQHFQRLRKESGLSQAKLAKRAGLESQTIRRWEKGATQPSLEHGAAAALALGLPLDDLIPDDWNQAAILRAEDALAIERQALERRRSRGKGRPSSDADPQGEEQ